MTSIDRSVRQAWLLTGVLVAAVIVIVVVFLVGFARIDAEGQRQVDAANAQRRAIKAEQARESCFQSWANATAHRTNTVSLASNARVDALDHLLDVRSRYAADSPQAKVAVRQAAAAGDVYERIVANNPPVPPLRVFCTSGLAQPSTPPSHHVPSSSTVPSGAPAANTPTARPSSATRIGTDATTPTATRTVTSTATPTRAPRPTRTVTTTSTPTATGGLLCPVVNLVLHC